MLDVQQMEDEERKKPLSEKQRALYIHEGCRQFDLDIRSSRGHFVCSDVFDMVHQATIHSPSSDGTICTALSIQYQAYSACPGWQPPYSIVYIH